LGNGLQGKEWYGERTKKPHHMKDKKVVVVKSRPGKDVKWLGGKQKSRTNKKGLI